ncbi:MAG TPA: hypothetical protein VMT76_08615 [Puia sp.]|nr:hypothetical protein [Puia sp.]
MAPEKLLFNLSELQIVGNIKISPVRGSQQLLPAYDNFNSNPLKVRFVLFCKNNFREIVEEGNEINPKIVAMNTKNFAVETNL